ncbi:transcriptional regulatory protein DEP1 [Cladophialophora carrionii]|uniref:Transcriptional regulatory protein DEP1 n=1 Tax=Cladophialophora carrionii TaxID=86049 RepID=A0A1C1CLA4_9EURO|nr:transcriptional regulatory protein DEP1 [Cladophialophora carrionii]
MDLAADSLLALSNATTTVAAKEEPLSDDDRSSSLSELEEDLEDGEDEEVEPTPLGDADSEAETERLQVTPENLQRKKPFESSPSKLAQRQDVDMRPEIESLTESLVSSPISSHPDSDNDDPLSDGPDADEELPIEAVPAGTSSPNKRKREESGSDLEEAPRSRRRRRPGSPESDDEKSELDSDGDEAPAPQTRKPIVEPEVEVGEQTEHAPEVAEEEQKEIEKTDTSEDSKGKSRSRLRRKTKEPVIPEPQPEEGEDAEAAEDSEPADADENDAEATLKSEEEQARRMAAMDSLMAIEKQFATLRDRLYDERIAAINHELQLLQEPKPAHPELIRQVEAVQRYRDEKFQIEQKLLVYKVGALKNKAVAERSQIHSQYFQTVRDIRERHLERISEHFYRIQRDRFKADSSIPSFSIPFPEKRSQQILQQTAYNKEVSILSGVAKYVGFPAAPELEATRQKDIEDDIQKMGISPAQIRPARPMQRPAMQSQMSGPQAEEQFLEQTPWANPQHPIHRLSRQNSNRSPMNEFLTPANQQRNMPDNLQPPGGSASTIADPSASAQASSAINTPHDGQHSASRTEVQAGPSALHNFRIHSASPLDKRRHPEPNDQPGKDKDVMATARDTGSSPLTSRAYFNATAPRPPAITAGTGRFSVR